MDNELVIIKQAIINEIEGYEFYAMAAKQAGGKEAEIAFLELADEERKHAEYLKELYTKIQNKDKGMELAFLTNPPSPKIFDWDNIKPGSNSLAMSVFGIGMDMEQASIEFYQKAKQQTQNPEAEKLYDILIGWERAHYDQFAKQYDLYKADWWAEQNFAPF